MECPYCKSKNLIWDYKNGTIVCADCGAVLDQIYDESSSFEEMESISGRYVSIYENFLSNYKSIVDRTNRIITENIKRNNRYNKAQKFDKDRFLFYNGSIVRESSFLPLKYIENNERLLIIYDFIDRIPKFKDKHIRYKIALAVYFYDQNLFKKVEDKLGISKKYFKKILSSISTRERILIKEKIDSILYERGLMNISM